MKRSSSNLPFKTMPVIFFGLVALLCLSFATLRGKHHSRVVKKEISAQEIALSFKSSNAPCLSAEVIRSFGCEPIGVDQATLTVRSDGAWDFSVHYCCNKKPSSCTSSGKGRSTSPGSVKHSEWSINTQTGCLELRVAQTY